jgi:hypothetical protein
MQSRDSSPITGLLLRWGAGEKECLGALVTLFQTTAPVNEAYLKLVDQSRAKLAESRAFRGDCGRN